MDLYVHYYGALVALERGDAAALSRRSTAPWPCGYPALLIRAAPDFASLRNDARFRKLAGVSEKATPS